MFVAAGDDVQGHKCFPSVSAVIGEQGVQVQDLVSHLRDPTRMLSTVSEC